MSAFDEALALLSGEIRQEIEELKAHRQRQDEAYLRLKREFEDLQRQVMPPPPRLSIPHPDRRRARRAEVKFAEDKS